MNCFLADHPSTMSNRYLMCKYTLPGPMEGSNGSLQIDTRPPSSKEGKRWLNPSPQGTRSWANFEKIAFHRGFYNPRKTLGFQG